MNKDYWFWNEVDWSLSVPYGWQTRFLEANDAILSVLTTEPVTAKFSIVDVKEKYGELRIYYVAEDVPDTTLDLIDDIIDSMTKATSKICSCCGKCATHRTTGYIIPLCEDCIENSDFRGGVIPIEEGDSAEPEEPVYKMTPKGALYLTLMDYSFTDVDFVEIWDTFTSSLNKAGYCIYDCKTGESYND